MTDRGDDERENATCPPGDGIMTDRGDISNIRKNRIPRDDPDDPDNPAHSFPLRKLSRWNPYRTITTSSTFCECTFPHRHASIRFVTVPRRHAIFQSNAVDDIIRYIKTLLTRQCVFCECIVANQMLRAILFAFELRNIVDGIYIILDSVYVHKRHSSLKGEALICLGNKARMFEQIHIDKNLPSYVTVVKKILHSFKLFLYKSFFPCFTCLNLIIFNLCDM